MEATQSALFLRFAVAIGIGFLIGLQREYAHGAGKRNITAGERTFSLVSLTGAFSAMLADQLDEPWVLVAGLALVGVYSAIGYLIEAWRAERIGITSEVAVVIAFLIGPLCYWGELSLAVAIGIATTVILSLKIQTDRFVRALTQEDITAALQLAVISAIVLPILPNREFLPAPFNVLNPFRIWLMVVFISAISFTGYVLIKVVGSNRGIGLTGLLGGFISSTAVTMSFSGRSRENRPHSRRIGQAIMLAWVVMFLRMPVEVALLNMPLVKVITPPLLITGLMGIAYSVFLYYSNKVDEVVEVEFVNPFNLSTAIKFGLVYTAVLLASSLAQHLFGTTGIIISSILSAIVNMTAVTLSLAQLSATGSISMTLAAESLVFGALSNTLGKSIIVFTTGSPELKKAILPGSLFVLAAGLCAVLVL